MTKLFIHINISSDEDFIRTDSYTKDGLKVLSSIIRTDAVGYTDASGVTLEQTEQTEQCLKHLGIPIPTEPHWEVFITNCWEQNKKNFKKNLHNLMNVLYYSITKKQ